MLAAFRLPESLEVNSLLKSLFLKTALGFIDLFYLCFYLFHLVFIIYFLQLFLGFAFSSFLNVFFFYISKSLNKE